jgi:hypothetical protein
MRISVLATAALALSPGTFAAEPSQPEALTTLFATICMQHFHASDELRAEMSSQDASVLEGEQSEFFLGGTTGTAWAVRASGGKYVVAWREDNVCAVFAQRAPVAEVQTNFAALVASAPEPLVASLREPEGPTNEALTSISYAWHRPEDKTELLFTLTTSSEASPTVQAMLSMAVVDKSDSSPKVKRLSGSP